MGKMRWALGTLCLAAVLALGWAATSRLRADECYACNRPIHAHSRTLAVVNGHGRTFCCPACALSLREQAEKPVKVTELTSFSTGAVLNPDSAYVVKGSDVNMCESAREMIDADHRPADLQYDRCAPSLLAFGSLAEAQDFARRHGGQARPFAEAAAR